ncbi:MAG: hypothetical protein E5V27_24140, partial [Mesorhizobium sp.]
FTVFAPTNEAFAALPAGTLQRVDETTGLDGCNQRRVIRRVDGVLDDVLGGIHGGAADHRILGIGGSGERGNGDRAGKQKGGEFTHDSISSGLSFPSLGRKQIRKMSV